MKKLMLASAMMFGLISFSFAQTSAAKTTKPAPDKMEAKKPVANSDVKTVAPAKSTKPVAKAPATTAKAPATAKTPAPAKAPATAPAKTTDKNGTVLKKDGTPDKRYTATPKTTTPVKKDGTPDKRYKENKKP